MFHESNNKRCVKFDGCNFLQFFPTLRISKDYYRNCCKNPRTTPAVLAMVVLSSLRYWLQLLLQQSFSLCHILLVAYCIQQHGHIIVAGINLLHWVVSLIQSATGQTQTVQLPRCWQFLQIYKVCEDHCLQVYDAI